MVAARALLVVLLLVPAMAVAKTVTVRGEGSARCASWVQEHERNSSRRPVQDSWVLGYVNAVSGALEIPGVEDVSAPFRNMDLVTWVDDYCRSHPDEELIRAADALMRYLALRALGGKDKI
jgi:hypothetical protein